VKLFIHSRDIHLQIFFPVLDGVFAFSYISMK